MDDVQDVFFRTEIADLVLLSAGVVTSLTGVYVAFKNLPANGAATPEVRALRPKATAVLTALYLTICVVSIAMMLPQRLETPYPPELRVAMRYIGAVVSVLDAGVTFLVLSFLIRLVDVVYGPPANASSPDAASKSSEKLIKFVGLAAILAIINMIIGFFSFSLDKPTTGIYAAYIAIGVISFVVNFIYITTSTITLIRTKKRASLSNVYGTSRGPLLAAAILAPLRYITDIVSTLIILGVSRLFDVPVLLKFIAAWGVVGIIVKQCSVAIIVLILVKVLVGHCANSASREDQDETRRPLLGAENDRPAGTFNGSS